MVGGSTGKLYETGAFNFKEILREKECNSERLNKTKDESMNL